MQCTESFRRSCIASGNVGLWIRLETNL